MAQDGGVLVRAGHTEAGCDLARLAGYEPASVICEIMNDDGTMARLPELLEFAKVHGLKIGTIRDLIHFRSAQEKLVKRLLERDFIGSHGNFKLYAYEDTVNDVIHFALSKGDLLSANEVLVRVHQPLSSLDCFDFTGQPYSFSLGQAMKAIERAEAGVLIILHRNETKSELLAMIESANQGMPRPMPWNSKLYGIGAQILRDLNVQKIRVMGNQHRFPSVSGFGLEIVGHLTAGEPPQPSLFQDSP
ncbi:MAG: ribB [Firmicutes bacterium]|nr:ribB [Bacillota bacterium]